jgi:hypothetical protein
MTSVSASSVSSADLADVATPRTLTADLSGGLQNEKLNSPLIKAVCSREFVKTEDPYHPMDWVSTHNGKRISHLYMEQKGCNNTYEDKKRIAYFSSRKGTGFNGFVMGKNKTDWLRRNKKKGIIFFKFSDQTRYIHYDPVAFKEFPTGMFQRKSRNRDGEIVDIEKPGIYIPFDKMILAPFNPDGTPMTQHQISLCKGEGCLIQDD